MEFLRTAKFGGLFAVTFMVAATFQIAIALLGILWAVVAPGSFNLNGAPAAGPGQAIVVDVVMLIAGLIFNAAMSAGGAGLWLLIRRVLMPNRARPSDVF